MKKHLLTLLSFFLLTNLLIAPFSPSMESSQENTKKKPITTDKRVHESKIVNNSPVHNAPPIQQKKISSRKRESRKYKKTANPASKHTHPSKTQIQASSDPAGEKYWVNAGANGTGTSEEDPAGNITFILNTYPLENDIINVKPGEYNTSIGEDFPLNFTDYSNITLTSTDTSSNTIIKGEWGTGIEIRAEDIAIKDFTLRNVHGGITLYESHAGNILNNNITSSGYSINIVRSTGAILSDNQMWGNGAGIGFTVEEKEHATTHLIDTTNTVDGKPLRYYKNQEAVTVPTNTGQVILANCTACNVTALSVNDIVSGIKLMYSNDCIIGDTTIINAREHGIKLIHTENTTIRKNKLKHNNGGGILLRDTQNTTISTNTFYDNSGGITLENASNNRILDNNITNCWDVGLYLKDSSDGNTVKANTITDCHEGIRIRESPKNLIEENNITNNGNSGVDIEWSSSGTTIRQNNISLNWKGVNVDSDLVEITENTIIKNSDYGIRLRDVQHNIVLHNRLISTNVGIRITDATENNTISRNVISKNSDGIQVDGSQNNRITGNNITNNSNIGVYLYSGANETQIYRNNFINNTISAKDEVGKNVFNNSMIGNYWSDYNGSDADDDDIGDFPYNISGNGRSKDYLPAMHMITDTTSPTLQITTPTEEEILTTENMTIEWSGYDKESYISYYEVQIDSHPWITVSNTTTSYTFTNLSDGRYTATIKAMDAFGNTERDTVSFTVNAAASLTYWVQAGSRGDGTSENDAAGNITYVLTHYHLTGDIIKVKPGMYGTGLEQFPLNFTQYGNVTLQAVGTEDVIIKGEGTDPDVDASCVKISTYNITIRGVIIRNGAYGVHLWDSEGSKVLNTTISNTYVGIYLNSSRDTNLTGNNITDTERAVKLLHSENTLLLHNHFFSEDTSFKIENSQYIILKENTISSEWDRGIYIRDSTHITLDGNNITTEDWGEEGLYIRGEEAAYYNHTILQNNLINGRAIYYFFQEEDLLLSNQNVDSIETMILAFCENITVKNVNLGKGGFLHLASTTNSLISNVSVTDVAPSILLTHSDNNRIKDCSTYGDGGFRLHDSDDNFLYRNLFKHTWDWQGALNLEQARNNTVKNNTFVDNEYGVKLEWDTSYNLFYLNSFIGNDHHLRDDGSHNFYNASVYGNYWDTYNGTDKDGDGIGESPYDIPNAGVDYCPLLAPYKNFPTGLILEPESGELVIGEIQINGTALDYDGYVTSVYFKIDEKSWDLVKESGGLWNYTLSFSTLSGLTHDLAVKVEDNQGNTNITEITVIALPHLLEDREIVLNATLRIGSELILRNSTLRMAGTTDGQHYIVVKKEGSLVLEEGSNITTNSTSQGDPYRYYIKILDGADFRMWDSTISYAGCAWGENGEKTGLWINTDDTIIKNSQIALNDQGILYFEAQNNTVLNTSFIKCNSAVHIRHSHKNTVKDCFINGSDGDAIRLEWGSENNRILWNDIVVQYSTGIRLEYAHHNIIKHNTIQTTSPWGHGLMIQGDQKEDYNHTILNNTLNGEPIYYFFNTNGQTFSSVRLTHLTLAYCENLVFENCNISNGDGVHIYHAQHITLSNCYISHENGKAIHLEHSSNNTLLGNHITNVEEGISLEGTSDNNTLSNNLLVECQDIAIDLRDSSYNLVQNNILANCSNNGFKVLWGSTHNIITQNNLTNIQEAISLNSDDNKIRKNNFINIDRLVEGSSTSYFYYNNFISYDKIFSGDEAHNRYTYNGFGNYWSKYTGNDTNGDGIGETSYKLGSTLYDTAPLIVPFSPAPTVLVYSPQNGSALANTVQLRGTSFDYDGNVTSLELKIGAYSWKTIQDTNNKWSYTLNTTQFEDGGYQLSLKAIDNASRICYSSLTVFMDNTLPQPEFQEPHNNSYVGGAVQITMFSHDVTPAYQKLLLAGEQLAEWEYRDQVTYRLHTGDYQDGSYQLTFSVTDQIGHSNETSIFIIIENEDPTLQIITPKEGTNFYLKGRNVSLTARWEGDDMGSGIGFYAIQVDEKAWMKTGVATFYTIHDLSSGEHLVKVKAVDVAENEKTHTVRFEIRRDHDRDGMPTEWEKAHGLDPYDASDAFADPDGDDLLNIEEFQYKTHPQKADTDDDGFSDGTEIEKGTDPLDPTSHPTGVSKRSFFLSKPFLFLLGTVTVSFGVGGYILKKKRLSTSNKN